MRIRWRTISSIAGALAAISATLLDLEGNVPVGYSDIAGVPTACVGHTGAGVVVGRGYLPAQCMAWLQSDTKKAWDVVDKYVTVPLPLYEHAAYTLFVFNVGEGNFKSSTLLKKLNAGDHEGACKELLRWNKARVVEGGKTVLRPVKGLTKRRQHEYKICIGEEV